MNLYKGKMLFVDLSEKKVTVKDLKQEWLRDYWGGWGLALRYYIDLVDPKIDPMSRENPIIIMTGPLTGTLMPLSSRLCMVSKSPKTGTIFESNAGGAFGPELKFAGYDGIVITGQSNDLVYLLIQDGDISIEGAEDLRGKGVFETEEALKEKHGMDVKTMTIGPAGENKILFSCVGLEGYRQFGRGGTGALFGNKNLKGIVCKGTGGVKVANMGSFLQKIREHMENNLLTEDNLWAKSDGTSILVGATNELGLHPTKNFTLGVNDQHENIGAEAVRNVKVSDRACSSCVMACGKFTSVDGIEVEGPEYETLVLGGSNCGINDLGSIIYFNRLCDDLGLDTISTGNLIGLAMDMTEKGRQDFKVKFGDSEEYLKITKEIATLSTERGRILSSGAKEMQKKYDCEDMITEVKGLEYPGYEPRGNYGMGLAYATSERGACHLRAFTIFTDEPFNLEVMAKEVIDGQNFNAIKWSMSICDFWGTINVEILADVLTVGLGENVSPDELKTAGERIWNLTRLFNVQAGFTNKEDYLPRKIMEQPLGNGPHAGKVFGKEEFDKMLKFYYRQRGWDEKGIPEESKIQELNLILK